MVIHMHIKLNELMNNYSQESLTTTALHIQSPTQSNT